MPHLYPLEASDSASKALGKAASPFRILACFFASYLMNLATTSLDTIWCPDFVALTILFWSIRQPQSIGMIVPFFMGVLMDINQGSVLGQQALAYVVLTYLAFQLHRRLPWFNPIGQAMHLFPLLLTAQIVVMLVRFWFDGLWPSWGWFLQSFTGALLWPVWIWLMQIKFKSRTSSEL